MTPLVSVNLCCYNSERFLEATLRSIYAQTFTDWELVIINDGSTDATDAIIRRHVAEGHRIVYHPQANAGLGASRNKAIELSTGKYIALIDHDDLWLPEKLARQVPQLESDSRVGLSYTDADVIDSDGRVLRRYVEADQMYEGNVLQQLFLSDFIACSSVVIRREALDCAGTFRPELKITEEYELFLRLATDWMFAVVREPLLQLRVHGGNASWNYVRTRRELESVIAEALERTPALWQQVGSRAVRIRLAGFACTPNEALLMLKPREAVRTVHRGRLFSAVSAGVKPLARYVTSLLPRRAVDAVVTGMAHYRRRER